MPLLWAMGRHSMSQFAELRGCPELKLGLALQNLSCLKLLIQNRSGGTYGVGKITFRCIPYSNATGIIFFTAFRFSSQFSLIRSFVN